VDLEAIDRPQDLDKVERRYNSDVLAEVLRELGFPYVPLTPGSSYRGLHDSIVNHLGNRDPQMILCLHEEVAISIAHGYAKATGEACPVLMHDLVGLMNGSMAVYNAFCDQAPVLIIGGGGPGDRGESRRPIDAIHSAESQGELVREYVKWVDDPRTLYDSVAGIMRARQFALSAPTGPTYVTIDVDVQEELIPENYVAPDPRDFAVAPAFAADPGLIEKAAKLLCAAKLPVISAGGRISLFPQATPLLVELVEKLGAAYFESETVAFPTNHPLNATPDHGVVDDCDVVLGVDLVDGSMLFGGSRGGKGGTTGDRIFIDLSCGDLHIKSWSNAYSNVIRRDVQLLSDPLVGLKALVEAVKATPPEEGEVAQRAAEVTQRVSENRTRRRAALEEHYDDTPISAGRLTSEIWEAVRDTNWLLTSRSGRCWYEGVFEFAGAGQFIGSSGGGGVGYGPGASVGAALAARDRGQFAVGIVGDGDFLMANTALWTAAHHQIPLLLVVNDNRSFGNDEDHQRRVAQLRDRPVVNSGIGVHIDAPAIDFAALARSMGCSGEGPITEPSQLRGALSSAVAAVSAGQVAVVHVVTEDA
jgi:thiamine pyrophosphate-dependent acetolactate synthase large subunit-like protein